MEYFYFASKHEGTTSIAFDSTVSFWTVFWSLVKDELCWASVQLNENCVYLLLFLDAPPMNSKYLSQGNFRVSAAFPTGSCYTQYRVFFTLCRIVLTRHFEHICDVPSSLFQFFILIRLTITNTYSTKAEGAWKYITTPRLNIETQVITKLLQKY